MNEVRRLIQQAALAVSVAVIGVAALLPTVLAQTASAAQVTSRSITMSTSAAGTAASYTIAFTPGTTEATGGLIVDFCSNDPLYNDTCSFSAATVPTVAGSLTTSAGTGTGIGTGSPVHTIQITGLSLTAGTPFSVTVSAGITNPTGVGTFYARILTYNGAPGYTPAATSGTSATLGSFVDYGGDALSTASNISITAKVFETLSFCVFNSSCGTAPSLTLGDPTTGALSSSSAYATNETGANSAQYSLATNAGSGVQVVMRGTTLCRSATPATDCVKAAGNYNPDTITAIGDATGTTQAAIAVGTEQFGMCADTTGVTGTLAAQVPYNDPTNSCHGQTTTSNVYSGTSKFGFNDDTAAGGTNNSAGSLVLKSTGAVSSYTGSLMFMANDAVTTEAGVYTTSLNMVATSTY